MANEFQFRPYFRKIVSTEMRPYIPGENMDGISISNTDKLTGSPKVGDMIARNSNNHNDMWLVSAEYFADNYMSKEEEEND